MTPALIVVSAILAAALLALAYMAVSLHRRRDIAITYDPIAPRPTTPDSPPDVVDAGDTGGPNSVRGAGVVSGVPSVGVLAPSLARSDPRTFSPDPASGRPNTALAGRGKFVNGVRLIGPGARVLGEMDEGQ